MVSPDRDTLRTMRDTLESAELQFLASRGWQNTSANPAYLVMYEKEVDGRVLMMPFRYALLMEGYSPGRMY
jgi:hypothetical protein